MLLRFYSKGLQKKSKMSHVQGADKEDVYEFPDLSATQKMALLVNKQ